MGEEYSMERYVINVCIMLFREQHGQVYFKEIFVLHGRTVSNQVRKLFAKPKSSGAFTAFVILQKLKLRIF